MNQHTYESAWVILASLAACPLLLAQDPPTLDAPRPEREQARRGVRLAHVWKFENRRFIPIAVDVGVSDDFWTEIVGGPLQPGDVVLTDAVPGPEKRPGEL